MSEAKCPNCGNVLVDSYEKEHWIDGEEDWFECDYCGERYWVTVKVDIQFVDIERYDDD